MGAKVFEASSACDIDIPIEHRGDFSHRAVIGFSAMVPEQHNNDIWWANAALGPANAVLRAWQTSTPLEVYHLLHSAFSAKQLETLGKKYQETLLKAPDDQKHHPALLILQYAVADIIHELETSNDNAEEKEAEDIYPYAHLHVRICGLLNDLVNVDSSLHVVVTRQDADVAAFFNAETARLSILIDQQRSSLEDARHHLAEYVPATQALFGRYDVRTLEGLRLQIGNFGLIGMFDEARGVLDDVYKRVRDMAGPARQEAVGSLKALVKSFEEWEGRVEEKPEELVDLS